MNDPMIWLIVAAAGGILGLHGGYHGALNDACLKIGTGFERSRAGGRGFQDAVTPPSSTTARLFNWIATVLLFASAWYYLGLTGLVASFLFRNLVSILASSSLKSDPPSKHFCRKIYVSMSNREADYSKAGDTVRAEAMRDLREGFEHSEYANQISR